MSITANQKSTPATAACDRTAEHDLVMNRSGLVIFSLDSNGARNVGTRARASDAWRALDAIDLG